MSEEKPKFHDLARETSQQIGEFPSVVRGQQIMVMMNDKQMTQFTLLCRLFRKHKMLSEAQAISVASRHFLNSVSEDDEIE
jgi:hypothetical protein